MKASVRCQSLDLAGLARAEKHGLREDWIGKKRQINDNDPLVIGGLNLAELYAEHIDGARQNKGAKKPILHFIVKFPPEVLTDAAPVRFARRDREGREALMLAQAARFINDSHGGEAVFAARLDRDEAGTTVVDVFACPRYMKESKSQRREPVLWTSATRFGEKLALKHQDHIRSRLNDAASTKPITSPRAVGIALQEELSVWFERKNGVRLFRSLKASPTPDWVAPEEWRLNQIRAEADEAEAKRALAETEAERIADEAETAAAVATAAKIEAEAEAQRVAAKSGALLTAAAALAEEVNAGTLRRNEAGKIVADDGPALLGGLPDLAPAIRAGADAVEARKRAEADAEAAKRARIAAETDAAAAVEARQKAEGLVQRLTGLMSKVAAWLRRPDLPDAARRSGEDLMREVGLPIPQQQERGGGKGGLWRLTGLDGKGSPAEKPSPEADLLDGPSL